MIYYLGNCISNQTTGYRSYRPQIKRENWIVPLTTNINNNSSRVIRNKYINVSSGSVATRPEFIFREFAFIIQYLLCGNRLVFKARRDSVGTLAESGREREREAKNRLVAWRGAVIMYSSSSSYLFGVGNRQGSLSSYFIIIINLQRAQEEIHFAVDINFNS